MAKLGRNLVGVAAVIAAGVLAYHGNGHWGWFLLVAAIAYA